MCRSNNTVHRQNDLPLGYFNIHLGRFKRYAKHQLHCDLSSCKKSVICHRCSKSKSTSQLVIGPVLYSKKWFLDPQKLLRKWTSTFVFHRFFHSSFSNSKKNSSSVRLSFKEPPAHMDIHWGWAVRQDLPIYLLFFQAKCGAGENLQSQPTSVTALRSCHIRTRKSTMQQHVRVQVQGRKSPS